MLDRVIIVVAAGTSTRFGGDKLMAPVAGVPLVAHTVAAVRDHADRCVLVCRHDQIPALSPLDLGVSIVPGGPSRTASEIAGLDAIGEEATLIGVHDGARPLVPHLLVEKLFETAGRVGGAIPVLEPSAPIVRRSDLSPVPGAVRAQTPQVFDGARLIAAYALAAKAGHEAHDTAAIARELGGIPIEAVPGDPGNIKVTTPADLDRVRTVLETSRSGPR